MKLYDLVFKLRLEIVKYQDRRSAWSKGVFKYEFEMLENLMDFENIDIEKLYQFRRACLNGATDFYELSGSGLYLIYDRDIAERLCNNTELKRTNCGEKAPNKFETWIDIQARALYAAYIDLVLHVSFILAWEAEDIEKL